MVLLVLAITYVPWQVWAVCGFLILLNATLK